MVELDDDGMITGSQVEPSDVLVVAFGPEPVCRRDLLLVDVHPRPVARSNEQKALQRLGQMQNAVQERERLAPLEVQRCGDVDRPAARRDDAPARRRRRLGIAFGRRDGDCLSEPPDESLLVGAGERVGLHVARPSVALRRGGDRPEREPRA